MRRTSWRHFDFWLLGAVAVLTLFGITMIRSAIAGNIELIEGNVVLKQVAFAFIGFIIIIIMSALDYRLLGSMSWTLYWLTIAILLIVFLVGEELFGSARWISVGPVNIQPSELAKITVILVLGDFYARNRKSEVDIKMVIKSLLVTLGIVGWIILQPDLSTSIVIFVIWFALTWASGLKINFLLIAVGIVVLLLLIGIPFLVLNSDDANQDALIKPYQLERITNFLFPDEGATYGANYNVKQALISIGSGGWFGKGYGSGSQVQLRFLKVRHSDFIFSAMAEEFGFAGSVLVIALLLFVIYRIFRIARLSSDKFGSLIAIGIAVVIAFQAIVNIGMNLKLLPVTGLTLPFMSYGGSSLLTFLLGVGLVESVILRHKSIEF